MKLSVEQTGSAVGVGVGVTTGAGEGVEHDGKIMLAGRVVDTPLPSLSVHTCICVEYLISQLRLLN